MKTETDSIFWGGVHLPPTMGTGHFGIYGGPGSGKTTLIQLLLQSVLPNIGKGSNRRAIIYDAKREMMSLLSAMGFSDLIYNCNPFDRRCVAWRMARDIDSPATATEMATIMVPEKGEREPFFPEAARGLMSGVMQTLIRKARDRWEMRDLINGMRSAERMKILLGLDDQTNHLIEKYLTGTDTQSDITATIENVVHRWAFIAAAWDNTHPERKISLSEWIKTESIILLGSNPVMDSTIQQLNGAILHRANQIILNQPEAKLQPIPPMTWIVIDELRMAGRLAMLPALMVQGRSKGACICIGTQDIGGVGHVYEDERLASEILGMPRNKAFLQITEAKTREWASHEFGDHLVERTRYLPSWGWSTTDASSGRTLTYSNNISVHKERVYERIVMPRQFKMILDSCKKNGISGYFDTSCLRNPYFYTFPGEFIEQNLTQPNPKIQNFEPRPREHEYLRDWNEADLQRLGLSNYPGLLNSKKAKRRKKTPKLPEANTKEPQSLMELLPNKPSITHGM